MFGSREFLFRAQLDAAALEAWIEAGWLAPRRAGPERLFSELDLARAALIRDLREAMGVNDEGVGVVLDLLDQVHGLRHAMQRLCAALQAMPEPLRQEFAQRVRATAADDAPPGEHAAVAPREAG